MDSSSKTHLGRTDSATVRADLVTPAPAVSDADDSALWAGLGLVGRSAAFRDALAMAQRFARCMAPVLIRGQSGNGKELFARAIHYLSARRPGPFVPVNCGAIPDMLLESELFGHVRGAFTDAHKDSAGMVALANGGTLFLDEIDSLSGKAQAALLRFLQDHEYRRVGGATLEHADVRVLSATNGDLAEGARCGRFRSDLLFRLDVLSLDVPTLSQRRDDIVLIARHFLARFAGFYGREMPQLEPDAEQWLAAQPWPGNVRQLENLMHRAYALDCTGHIGLHDLAPDQAADPKTPGAGFEGGLKLARERCLREFERAYLQRLLALTHGNVTEASQRAGMERRAMGRLLVRNGIDKERFR
jgi:DNA-binding NtrC family response regulator